MKYLLNGIWFFKTQFIEKYLTKLLIRKIFFLVISEFINGFKNYYWSDSLYLILYITNIDLILLEIVLVVMMDGGTGWTVGR